MKLRQRLFARVEPLRLGPDGRTGLWVGLLLAAASAWASWAVIDEQVRGQATVIVSSRSQVVQTVDGGVISELRVREGDVVASGDLIAVLNPARAQASTDEIVAKTLSLKAVMQRLEAEISDQPLRFTDELRKHPGIIRGETRLYERRRQRLDDEIESLQATLEFANQELEALTRLSATGDASATELLRARRQSAELQAKITNRQNDYYQEAQAELSRTRGELAQAEQILAQRRDALSSLKIYAPMSGIVTNVRFTTLGAVMRAGDELLQIVPTDEPLIIEAKISPRDVAFVRPGLPANVKMDAYDYSIYGGFQGEVTYISPDTVTDEDQTGRAEPSYRVHITIAPDTETRRGKVEVLPGMTATAEIITGRRTVAQYLLKPIIKARNDAFTER